MKHRSARLPLLALVALPLACSSAPLPGDGSGKLSPNGAASAQAKSDAKPDARPPAPPEGLRLPRNAHPMRYSATLTIVPGKDELRGEIAIDLDLAEPTSVIWLDAEGLTVDKAHLEAAAKTIPLKIVPAEGKVGFSLEMPAPAGAARLSLEYRGSISSRDDHGAFREDHAGIPYVFSHFEATAARRVFPCVDDPGVKVPWQLSLRVREGDVAISNTPPLGETKEEGGMKLVRFSETRPLPSYLVAFAVGPFELVDAGVAGQNKVPVRIVVPKGEKVKAAYAVKATPPLLGKLEEYTGIAYPYEKLDIVSVPQLATFGAMENPGLITFSARGSLATGAEETEQFRRGYTGTMAHELAHQWFGNLVTMDFWEDIWLNESFATWMGGKIVERVAPSWHEEARRVGSTAYAMGEDGLVSARKIRQEIRSADDIANAFDGITYQKGAAVLNSFELFVGPEKFQRGVRRYLNDHAHGNATAADFLSALSAETSTEIGPAFATYLDQPGIPVVKAELSCEKGQAPSVKLSQSRWLPSGSSGKDAASAPSWQIPVCFRYGNASADGQACTLLTGKTGVLPLPQAKTCPAWIAPKTGGFGYYRTDLGKDNLFALLDKHKKNLSVAERLALLSDADALVESRVISLADVLAIVPKLAAEKDPMIQRAAANLVLRVRDAYVSEELRPKFANFVNKTFGKQARALGLSPKASEAEETNQLRWTLAMLVANRGNDAKMIADLRALALRWIDDPASTTHELGTMAVLVSARNGGDRALFDKIMKAVHNEKTMQRRAALLDTLTSFRDPALADEVLKSVLDESLDPRESMWLLGIDETVLTRSLSFVEKNWARIKERLPSEALGYLPMAYAGMCTEDDRKAVARVFEPHVGEVVGGPRALAQALEVISLCDTRRRELLPSLKAFLEKY